MYPKVAPVPAPIINRGKKIPPGAPEPKLNMENKNFFDEKAGFLKHILNLYR